MDEKKTVKKKEIKNFQYLKLNSSSLFEFLSDIDYSKEMSNLANIFAERNYIINEEIINKYIINILPETKEEDLLKMNFALSSGCKKNKINSHKCLNEIMNMQETSSLILTKDYASKLSQVIKEIFRKFKKYTSIKTYEDLITKAKDFWFQGRNFINKFMVEKKEEDSDKTKTWKDSLLSIFKSDKKNEKNNNSNEELDKSKNLENDNKEGKELVFEFKETKEEKKKGKLPTEMRCLIKKFGTVKNLKLSINDKMFQDEKDEYNFDIKDIQNIIIILYNTEWLFQNLLEIEIDLSNSNLFTKQLNMQKQKLKILSDILNQNKKISTYHFGLNKSTIFNPYQLSNFYSSFPKLKKDNFLYIYKNINGKNTLTYELDKENEIIENEKSIDEYIMSKKYIFEMIVVYAYFLLKIKNIRIGYLIHPINYKDEIIKVLKTDKVFLDDFNFLGFFRNNNIHQFTVDFNSLDHQSFQKVLYFLSQNGLVKIFRINFFKSEEYFLSEMLYKVLQNNESIYEEIDPNNLASNDNYSYINDLKKNENLNEYILRKLYKKFELNINYFFYLITMRSNLRELSIILDMPDILINQYKYNSLILKLILNLLTFIASPMSFLDILSIQAESIIIDTRKNILLPNFFEDLCLCEKKESKLKSFTLNCKLYHINNIYKLIPLGIEDLSLGPMDLETFINLSNYLTSIDFSEISKLKKLHIYLDNSIFKYEQCKEYLEQLLIEHPRNLVQISIYTYITIKYIDLKELLLKTNYNIMENIFFQFTKESLKDEGYKEKLQLEEYKQKIIIDRNFMDLFCVQRKKKNTNMILNLINKLSQKFNKSFYHYYIFLNIEKFIESMQKKMNVVEFK